MEDDLDFEVASEWGDDDDDLARGARRRRTWVRATAAGLAAILVLSTVGTVTLVLLRRSSRAACDAAAFADLDLVGVTVTEARRTLERAPYRCARDTTVAVAVTDLQACDTHRPGTITRQGRLSWNVEGKPFVPVTVCGSATSA